MTDDIIASVRSGLKGKAMEMGGGPKCSYSRTRDRIKGEQKASFNLELNTKEEHMRKHGGNNANRQRETEGGTQENTGELKDT